MLSCMVFCSSLATTIHSVYYSMTQTMSPYHVIFEAEPGFTDAAFTIEELKDIVNHGMSAGVPMFIYTKDNVAWFDENEDTIEEYLSDWYHDNMGEDNYIHAMTDGKPEIASIRALKQLMVWSYVELKAHEILCSVDPNY
jgi:hypothetical protein